MTRETAPAEALHEEIERLRLAPGWPHLEAALWAVIEAAKRSPSHPVWPPLKIVAGGRTG